jgi:sulfite reductase (NADPH) hemoprotein beta-component
MSHSQKKEIPLTEVEHIKEKSRFLRGTINESLIDNITGAMRADDTHLIKFHGTYQQSDRDTESERKKQKLEPLYSFMIRVRVPGGIASPSQFFRICELADQYANGSIKLTTRQAFQLHGVFKRNLKTTIRKINDTLLDTIAACGDVNRNVMCNPLSEISEIHREVYEDAVRTSGHLTPQTSAYHEIWLDDQLISNSLEEEEPVYGKTYLPRKFKIAFTIPPDNDTDIYANDLGFIAITEGDQLIGYNVVAGGGMGVTFGNPATYPRLASPIGFIPKEMVLQVAEEVVKIQRDNGNRSDRKVARLKYTIDRLGLSWFVDELQKRLTWELQPSRPFRFTSNSDRYGWQKSGTGLWHYTLFVEGGRIVDHDNPKMKKALVEIAGIHQGDFRLTGNQNLVIANIPAFAKQKISALLNKYGIVNNIRHSGLRLNSLACVALNTCPLAFAEAERYLPSLITKLEASLTHYGIEKQSISIRMTGCPNGCARPYLAEIGLVGKSIGYYNLYLGGNEVGSRINILYKETLNEQQILDILDPVFKSYSTERNRNEYFGDYVIRKGIVEHVKQGEA